MTGLVHDVTIAAAAVGAVLGVLNLWFAIWRERVRLRVRFFVVKEKPDSVGELWEVLATMLPGEEIDNFPGTACGIEVVNLSLYAVTIEEVAFRKGLKPGSNRSVIVEAKGAKNQPHTIQFPARLEARAGFQCYASDTIFPMVRERKFLYVHARTQCGREVISRIRWRWFERYFRK